MLDRKLATCDVTPGWEQTAQSLGQKATTVRGGVKPCEENPLTQVDGGLKSDFKCICCSAQSTLLV